MKKQWTEIYPNHKNRLDAILLEVKHSNVLDVGSEDMGGDQFLSKAMEKSARKITRIDITKGQNFEKCRLGKKFECIVAGEILEHLNNVGLFLKNCSRHLEDNGKLIITTPNPYSMERILGHIISGKWKPDIYDGKNIGEHTMYFTFEVLERLLTKHNFAIDRKYYVNHEIKDKNFKGSNKPNLAKLIHKIKYAANNIRPKFRQTLLVVAT